MTPELLEDDALTFAARALIHAGCEPTPDRVHAVASKATAALFAADLDDPAVLGSVLAPVLVAETYFFREPRHFEIVYEHLAAIDSPEVRIWSAGCATGEEAYSLAAVVSAALDGDARPRDVLGTDLSPANVEAARRATYGPWSFRSTGPLLHPVTRESEGPRTIDLPLRALTRFAVHNLMAEPPEGRDRFDVILCRNVLLYLTPEACRAVLENLVTALRPGGLLLFGAMDLQAAPVGVLRVHESEANAFVKPRPNAPRAGFRAPRVAPLPSLPTTAAPLATTREVRHHLEVLEAVERGHDDLAGRLLAALLREAPAYVIGRFELALWHRRRGGERAAIEAMRLFLDSVSALDDDELLEGPERLPVRYYRVAARALLGSS